MVEPTPHTPPRKGTDDFDAGTLDGLPPFPEADDVDPPQASSAPPEKPWQLVLMFALVALALLLGAVALA